MTYRGSSVFLNPIALRKAKIVCNFGLSECNRIKIWLNAVRNLKDEDGMTNSIDSNQTAMFNQPCLSQYLKLLQYVYFNIMICNSTKTLIMPWQLLHLKSPSISSLIYPVFKHTFSIQVSNQFTTLLIQNIQTYRKINR